MIAKFYDRQDASNPFNGSLVASQRDVEAILDGIENREPFFCELVGDNGYSLLVGVGSQSGCVQYSRNDGTPPYFMARLNRFQADRSESTQDYVEFLIADTMSPIPTRYCLPMDSVKSISAHFCETGERSSSFAWEEI